MFKDVSLFINWDFLFRLAILGAGFVNVVMSASVAFLTVKFCRRTLMMISTIGVSTFLIVLAICIYFIVISSYVIWVPKRGIYILECNFSIRAPQLGFLTVALLLCYSTWYFSTSGSDLCHFSYLQVLCDNPYFYVTLINNFSNRWMVVFRAHSSRTEASCYVSGLFDEFFHKFPYRHDFPVDTKCHGRLYIWYFCGCHHGPSGFLVFQTTGNFQVTPCSFFQLSNC